MLYKQPHTCVHMYSVLTWCSSSCLMLATAHQLHSRSWSCCITKSTLIFSSVGKCITLQQMFYAKKQYRGMRLQCEENRKWYNKNVVDYVHTSLMGVFPQLVEHCQMVEEGVGSQSTVLVERRGRPEEPVSSPCSCCETDQHSALGAGYHHDYLSQCWCKKMKVFGYIGKIQCCRG